MKKIILMMGILFSLIMLGGCSNSISETETKNEVDSILKNLDWVQIVNQLDLRNPDLVGQLAFFLPGNEFLISSTPTEDNKQLVLTYGVSETQTPQEYDDFFQNSTRARNIVMLNSAILVALSDQLDSIKVAFKVPEEQTIVLERKVIEDFYGQDLMIYIKDAAIKINSLFKETVTAQEEVNQLFEAIVFK